MNFYGPPIKRELIQALFTGPDAEAQVVLARLGRSAGNTARRVLLVGFLGTTGAGSSVKAGFSKSDLSRALGPAMVVPTYSLAATSMVPQPLELWLNDAEELWAAVNTVVALGASDTVALIGTVEYYDASLVSEMRAMLNWLSPAWKKK